MLHGQPAVNESVNYRCGQCGEGGRGGGEALRCTNEIKGADRGVVPVAVT